MNTLSPLPLIWEKGHCPLASLVNDPTFSVLDEFSQTLEHIGAILLRGYDVTSVQKLVRAISALGGKPMPYVEGNSPRTKLDSEHVYTSTEHPAEAVISLHNELSYSGTWPTRLYFCCVTPPLTGGHTLIADSAAILANLVPDVRDAFESKGVLYIRNLHGGKGLTLGPSWQDTFETTDRTVVQTYCARQNIEFQWLANDTLRLITRRSSTAVHPGTGRKVWFNQADQFHPSTNSPDVYESLVEVFGDDPFAFPQHASFGDGSEISADVLAHIREITEQHTVRFDWQRGDCLVIDNMLVSHGRSPFTGERKVLVAMSL